MTTVEVREQQQAQSWFTERPIWYLTAAAIALHVIVFGAGLRPDMLWIEALMDDPWSIPPWLSVQSTDQSSPLMWLVGDLVGIRSHNAYVVLFAVFTVGCVLLSAYAVARWVSDFAGRVFVAAWYASPVAAIQFAWLGKPDPGTMLAAVLVTVGPRWASVAGGMMLGFNHFEQGVFIVLAAAVVRRYLVNVPGRNTAAAMVGGLLVGRVLLHLYHGVAGVETTSRIDYVLDRGPGVFIEGWLPHTPALIFGVFGVLWVPILLMSRGLEQRQRVALWAVFAAVTLPVLITFDVTRVHSLVTFPIAVAAVVHFAQAEHRETVRRWVPWFLVAATFVPVVNVWGGKVFVFGWSIA